MTILLVCSEKEQAFISEIKEFYQDNLSLTPDTLDKICAYFPRMTRFQCQNPALIDNNDDILYYFVKLFAIDQEKSGISRAQREKMQQWIKHFQYKDSPSSPQKPLPLSDHRKLSDIIEKFDRIEFAPVAHPIQQESATKKPEQPPQKTIPDLSQEHKNEIKTIELKHQDEIIKLTDALNQTIEENDAAQRDLNKKILDLESIIKSLSETITQKETEIGKQKSTIKTLSQEIEKNKPASGSAIQRQFNQATILQNYKNDNQKLTEQNQELNQAIKRITEENVALNKRIEELTQKTEHLEKTHPPKIDGKTPILVRQTIIRCPNCETCKSGQPHYVAPEAEIPYKKPVLIRTPRQEQGTQTDPLQVPENPSDPLKTYADRARKSATAAASRPEPVPKEVTKPKQTLPLLGKTFSAVVNTPACEKTPSPPVIPQRVGLDLTSRKPSSQGAAFRRP